jgi:hypothetical protein
LVLIAVSAAAVIMAAVSVQIYRTRFSGPKVQEGPAPSAALAAAPEVPKPDPAPAPSPEPTEATTQVAAAPSAPAPSPPPVQAAPEPASRAPSPPSGLAVASTPKRDTAPKKNTAALEAALQASRPADTKPADDKPTAALPSSGTLPKVVLAEEPGSDDDKPAAPSGPAFDTSAAKSALETAASGAGSCKTDDGPTGRGKVQVTFAPDGHASGVNVTDGTFAGTSVGSCVSRLFRAAHVPAFSGNPVTVSKSFSIPE